YTNTTFDDAATTPIFFGQAPFTGSFQPEQPLRALVGKGINGAWVLEINDLFAPDFGTLVNWSLSIESGVVLPSAVQTGNRMAQTPNGTAGEDPGDVYAAPRSPGATPLRPPYDLATLPLIVPGPYVVGSRVPNTTPSPDNLVLNGTANALDVTFDR